MKMLKHAAAQGDPISPNYLTINTTTWAEQVNCKLFFFSCMLIFEVYTFAWSSCGLLSCVDVKTMRMFKTCSFEFSVQASVHYSQATTQLFVRCLLFLLQTQAQVQLFTACNLYCKHKQQKAAHSLETRRYTNTIAMQVLQDIEILAWRWSDLQTIVV